MGRSARHRTGEAHLLGDAELPRERRDRDAFLHAGYQLVGDRGSEGLTVAALCNRVGTTKGSFYHHFDDLPEFVSALADRWQAWHLHVFSTIDAVPDPRRRLEFGMNLASAIMAPGATAIRVWATTNPVLTAAMPPAHEFAMEMCTRGFAELAEDVDSGPVFAALAAAVIIGTQHRPRPFDREHWLTLSAEQFNRTGIGNHVRRVGGKAHMAIHSSHRLKPVSATSGSISTTAFDTSLPLETVQTSRSARAAYFAGAWELLAESGSDALTSRSLAQRVGATKGSFVHHFGSVPEFHGALAEHWERAESDRLARCCRERNPYRRLDLLLAGLLIRPSRATSVWRAWGHANPIVGDAVRRVDDRVETALALTLAQLSDEPAARGVAELTVAFALGLHRWYPPFDHDLATRAAIEWARRILHIDAEVDLVGGRPRPTFKRL